MADPTGQSPASHEGVDVSVTLRQRLDALLCGYEALATPGRREYDQLLDDLILTARKSVAAQFKDHVRLDTITTEEIAR
jgi:hypothetical protein